MVKTKEQQNTLFKLSSHRSKSFIALVFAVLPYTTFRTITHYSKKKYLICIT